MTKEELIALSDLNREDNIKYISSEAQGIAIALDSDRYAPNFCKLERAYICGRRKSEEQIEQLEKENAELENDYKLIDKSREHLVQEKYNLEYKIENLENKIEHHQEVINTLQKKNAELEKENAKLKEAIKHFNPCGEWNDDVHDCEFRHYAIEYGSKLTKAKKIIEKVAKMYRYSPRVDEIIEQAEQFLKEE